MRLIILFVAIAMAAGAFYITMRFTAPPPEQPVIVQPAAPQYEKTPTVDIYVAKKDIPIGTIIKQEMLDIQAWPKHLKIEDMVEANPNVQSDLIKMVVRTPFAKGEPIMLNGLANEKDPSFLASVLPKGMRVVTIAVDQVSGVGGFVFPGDHVDVLITHDISLSRYSETGGGGAGAPGDAKQGPKKDPITEVLLSNVRVMAINQKSAIRAGDTPTAASNVSLEVAANDAQKLRLAENGNGRLSLTLRSLYDRDENELARPTGLGDLSRLTPPAYFSVLYDTNGQVRKSAAEVAGAPKEEEPVKIGKSEIVVVRGVKTEVIEVTQP